MTASHDELQVWAVGHGRCTYFTAVNMNTVSCHWLGLRCHIDTDVIHPPQDVPLIVSVLGAETAHFLPHLKVLNQNSSGMQSCLAAKVAAADKTLLSVSSV